MIEFGPLSDFLLETDEMDYSHPLVRADCLEMYLNHLPTELDWPDNDGGDGRYDMHKPGGLPPAMRSTAGPSGMGGRPVDFWRGLV